MTTSVAKESQNSCALLNKFSVKVVRQCFSFDPKLPCNVFMSPCSVYAGLALVACAQQGSGARALLDFLDLSIPDREHGVGSRHKIAWENHLRALTDLRAACTEDTETSTFLFSNAVFHHSNKYTLCDDYIEIVREELDAEMKPVDFSDQTRSCREINDWIDGNTRGLITDIASPDSERQLFVANAVYFKGMWATPFDKQLTEEGVFYSIDGSETTTSFMELTDLEGVTHHAVIKVDEEGSEAAAVTCVDFVDGGKCVKFNRPFLFSIRNRHSGLVLFAGAFVKP